jgi:hypothetical protein
MPEPTSTALGTATAVALGATVPILGTIATAAPQIVILGVATGLRADILLAGFGGAVCAIAFFNAVPSTGDTWRELVRTAFKRAGFTLASAVAAGYLTPLLMLADGLLSVPIPEKLVLSVGFAAGLGAQRWMSRLLKRADAPPAGGNDVA